jgi:glutamine synthetase type III
MKSHSMVLMDRQAQQLVYCHQYRQKSTFSQKSRKDLRFLTFFVNTIRAVMQHADLLRASIASASNDHRLGANEAPPAIVSVYIGKALKEVLDL